MFRRFAFLSITLLSAPAMADDAPLRFKWQKDQVLTYKVSQQTRVRETTLDEKTRRPATSEANIHLALVKKWRVAAVDAAGVATLEMSIVELRNEIRQPDGDTLVVDTNNPKDAKELAQSSGVTVGATILTIRVDARGQVVEVKEAKGGSASRLSAELPFRLILPEAGPAAGQTWDRTFTFKLDPPLGAGESYEFTQGFRASGVANGLAAAAVETTLKAPPKTIAERVPLVPMLWTGEVYFDPAAGRYHAARLKVKAELPNYQGEGTKFEYESIYVEDLLLK